MFPAVHTQEDDKPRIVTQARLNRAKFQALRLVKKHEEDILLAFELAARDRSDKIKRVRVDIDKVSQRIRCCKLGECEGCYGESDDEEVYVNQNQVHTRNELIGTILHESLHYVCKECRGHGLRYMCTQAEHVAMTYLGEKY